MPEVIEYIGDRGIKSFEAVDGGNAVEVEFTDGFKTKLNGTLFFHLKTDHKREGVSITDLVNDYFARRFVAELAEHGLEYYMVESVGVAMRVLSHNLREIAIKKVFNCSGGDAIPLAVLIDSVDVTPPPLSEDALEEASALANNQ